MSRVTREAPTPADVVLRGVSKRYPDKNALHELDLHIEPGKMTVLLGPSGCGKTTLLRILAGLDAPTHGTVTIGGIDATQLSPARRNVGMVFQQYGLYPTKTVEENIGYPLRIQKVAADERRRRVHDIASRLGLSELLSRKPHQLSGGQKQRVGLGRALIRNPALLLLDEPLSNLDAALRQSMRAEIRQLQQSTECTAVFVTHDQDEALAIADNIVLMRDGRVEQFGSAVEVYDRPATRFAAGFIGQSNLFEVDRMREPETILSPRLRDWIRGHGVSVIAFRPDAVRPDATGADLRVSGTPVQVELLGLTVQIHVHVLGLQIRVIVPRETPTDLENLRFSVPLPALHLFDSTGSRVPGPTAD